MVQRVLHSIGSQRSVCDDLKTQSINGDVYYRQSHCRVSNILPHDFTFIVHHGKYYDSVFMHAGVRLYMIQPEHTIFVAKESELSAHCIPPNFIYNESDPFCKSRVHPPTVWGFKEEQDLIRV